MTSIDSIFAPAIRGRFYRAIDPNFREFAIAGSRSAGRYSRVHEPTLYLSSSVDGVEVAMIAHRDARPVALEIVELDVEASGIVDLRDANALQAAGVDLADAVAPWQDIADAGGTPSSWAVRDRLVEVGANGLIDPSRKRPGLWHLVLFRWNAVDAPTIRLGGQLGGAAD
ncbi:RES domain-containing protein [Microbacterium esteraromaticum]|uniref:RES family NAD+ phosphorylase n=1 Tax=Microbacterium esteraromaticum TaxID=57043 RepID=UPI002368A7F0|nr:RES domain-containing protein [Microbacterium esteraromaticum]WDH77534.1 RES domain-containing protein [Microbacterium esteraromaticum]